jgi:putative transposase
MARPLRIEFSGALYHITSRGNAQCDIFLNDDDRIRFLDQLSQAVSRYDWYCHAYCLMDNHYHLLIETGAPTLSVGMKYLNGTYTQSFNRLHQRAGHVFQGRYKAILVEKESYLLELSRHIVLNPVRAKMVRSAKEWRWSSYRATAGQTEAHPCLTTESVLSVLGKRRKKAQEKYRAFISDGRNQPSPWERVKNQIYLGSDQFVEAMHCKLDPGQSLKNKPRKQKQAVQRPISYYAKKGVERNKAMAKAYLSRQYTLEQVGEYFGCSYATVSRAVKAYEAQM